MTVPPEVRDLLCRVPGGDAAAADALARALRPELVRLAGLRLRDRALVEDVAQESLLEVLATCAALREPAATAAWLRLIVRKHADRATRRSRPTASLDAAAGAADVFADGPEALAERRGDVATIRRALRVVRDADALLLRLRYLGEWSDAELAELVGAAPGTVRKRLHDARRRLRAAVEAPPSVRPDHHHERPDPHHERKSAPMTTPPDLPALLGRVVHPAEIPAGTDLTPSPTGSRLETGIKVLDAVVPVERGGTVDLLGPAGLGQLVLVCEIALHVDAVIVGVGDALRPLVAEDGLPDRSVAVAGDDAAAVDAGTRLGGMLAAAGREVLLVLSAAAWEVAPPRPGASAAWAGGGAVTAFRFAPHPRDGEPNAPLVDAGTTLVWAIDPFVRGHHPAIDVAASRSRLVEHGLLDPVTVGAARAARAALTRAVRVQEFLSQPLRVGEPYTGVPGEQVPAREATERLAALVR